MQPIDNIQLSSNQPRKRADAQKTKVRVNLDFISRGKFFPPSDPSFEVIDDKNEEFIVVREKLPSVAGKSVQAAYRQYHIPKKGYIRKSDVKIEFVKKVDSKYLADSAAELMVQERFRGASHPCICLFTVEGTQTISAYASYGNLGDLAEQWYNETKHALLGSDLYAILYSMISALSFADLFGVSHGDIGPYNILIQSNRLCQLIDWGKALLWSIKEDQRRCSRPYPENYAQPPDSCVHYRRCTDFYMLCAMLIVLAICPNRTRPPGFPFTLTADTMGSYDQWLEWAPRSPDADFYPHARAADEKHSPIFKQFLKEMWSVLEMNDPSKMWSLFDAAATFGAFPAQLQKRSGLLEFAEKTYKQWDVHFKNWTYDEDSAIEAILKAGEERVESKEELRRGKLDRVTWDMVARIPVLKNRSTTAIEKRARKLLRKRNEMKKSEM